MSESERSRILDWLMDKGGPVIRYRTAVELLGGVSGAERRKLLRRLVASPSAQYWLAALAPGETHSSNDIAFENATGKLFELGFRAGVPPFDARTAPFVRNAGSLRRSEGMHATLEVAIMLGGLIRAGYATSALRELLHWRLDMLYEAVKDREYDIYAPPKQSTHVPASYRRRMPLVRPEFCEPRGLRLPYIHDLLALSAADACLSLAGRRKVDHVVRYVLDEKYQSLHRGYGCLVRGDRGKLRCNAIGWSVHLPGFFGFDADAGYPDLVLLVELMAHFERARRHPWFRNALRHLDSFRTDEGTWCFPRSYLQERRGYYVIGAHMRLDANASLELNSTFRMMRTAHLLIRG